MISHLILTIAYQIVPLTLDRILTSLTANPSEIGRFYTSSGQAPRRTEGAYKFEGVVGFNTAQLGLKGI